MDNLNRKKLELLETDSIEKLIKYLKSVETSEQSLMLLGEAYRKKQDWKNALNTFYELLDIYPENDKAKSYVLMIQNILNYYNTDLINP